LIEAADHTFNDPCAYRKTVLQNGLRIVTEEIPYFRSVAIGIWVGVGSRFESRPENGISHFIEHMLFKGTERRSAFDISKEIDLLGGGLNAFTGKEFTSFYCRVLGEHLPRALDLLADIFLHSTFPTEEIEQEKSVVCQEIGLLDDSPEELIHEIVAEAFWRGHPLSQPILGTTDNIVSLSRDDVMRFRSKGYTPRNTVVAAAGRLTHEDFVDLVEARSVFFQNESSAPLSAAPPPPPQSRIQSQERDLEQVHLCLGAPAPGSVDERRHAFYLLNAALGGGMTSRLFQEVREKRGLAYSVYSYIAGFSDCGMTGVYAGFDPSRLDELMEVVSREIRRLPSTISQDDLETARTQIQGAALLGLESSEARMNRLARNEHTFGRYVPIEETLAGLDAVTLDTLRQEAERLSHDGPWTVAGLGPLSDPCALEGFLFR
jgi:predicted Zn-dependent peptidase